MSCARSPNHLLRAVSPTLVQTNWPAAESAAGQNLPSAQTGLFIWAYMAGMLRPALTAGLIGWMVLAKQPLGGNDNGNEN